MSKMKDLIIEICEMYEIGMEFSEIANAVGLSPDQIEKVIATYFNEFIA